MSQAVKKLWQEGGEPGLLAWLKECKRDFEIRTLLRRSQRTGDFEPGEMRRWRNDLLRARKGGLRKRSRLGLWSEKVDLVGYCEGHIRRRERILGKEATRHGRRIEDHDRYYWLPALVCYSQFIFRRSQPHWKWVSQYAAEELNLGEDVVQIQPAWRKMVRKLERLAREPSVVAESLCELTLRSVLAPLMWWRQRQFLSDRAAVRELKEEYRSQRLWEKFSRSELEYFERRDGSQRSLWKTPLSRDELRYLTIAGRQMPFLKRRIAIIKRLAAV